MTILVDVLVILFLIGLVINFVILLISMIRLIRFLVKQQWLRLTAFSFLAPLSILFTNECLQIMAYLWGTTAYLYSLKIFNDGIIDYLEFFQRSDKAVGFFKWSRKLSLIFSTIMSFTFFALLMALSFKFQASKNKNNS